MIADYFPWGIAEGKTFCNRVDEGKRLLNNINNVRHTLLISPRRYGKSSLARHTLKAANVLHAEVDFFLVVDDKTIEHRILKGIRELIQMVSDTPEQWFSTLKNFFNRTDKKWTIGIRGLSLELIPENHNYIADNILDGLTALEHILQKKKQNAVLFIDEFQEITKSKSGTAIEGAIRHFAQGAKHVTFIFSGSNRKMLSSMFSDRGRPLYQLCDRIALQRMDPVHYKKYLDEIAAKTWNEAVKQDVFDEIIKLTECHPNYVYILCSYIWQNFPEKQPLASDISAIWDNYVDELLKETRAELANLSNGQLKVLITISLGVNKELTGKEVQKKMNLTSAAIVYSLRTLEGMDYIETIDAGAFHIINPVISRTLYKFYNEIP